MGRNVRKEKLENVRGVCCTSNEQPLSIIHYTSLTRESYIYLHVECQLLWVLSTIRSSGEFPTIHHGLHVLASLNS